MRIQNIAGSPVEGADFFGRTAILAAFRNLLTTDDILLLGPRRIGKTSLARRLMADQQKEPCGWRAIEINVASCSDERAFVDKLATAVKAAAGSWTGGILDGVTGLLDRVRSVRLPGEVGFDLAAREDRWEAVASDTLKLLAGQSRATLIYIDELPIFLANLVRFDAATGVERVRRFLDWFRNDVRAMPGAKNLHWLISGSIGLDTLVQRYGMADTINSLRHRALDPYGRDEALSFLERLAQSYDLPFTPEDRDHLLTAIGWPQPYYLQLAFQNIRTMCQQHQPPGEVIDAAVARLIASGEDNDFHHWQERLHLQLDPTDADLAVVLLKLACRNRQGATVSTLFAELQRRLPNDSEDRQEQRFIQLRDVLTRDAYWCLDESDGGRRYRFQLEPLRCWWLRRHTL